MLSCGLLPATPAVSQVSWLPTPIFLDQMRCWGEPLIAAVACPANASVLLVDAAWYITW